MKTFLRLRVSRWIVPRMRTDSNKRSRENQNTHFMSCSFFRKSCRLWDNVKNMVEPQRPRMAIWRCAARWISKAPRARAHTSALAPTPTHTQARIRTHLPMPPPHTHTHKHQLSEKLLDSLTAEDGAIGSPETSVLNQTCLYRVLLYRVLLYRLLLYKVLL